MSKYEPGSDGAAEHEAMNSELCSEHRVSHGLSSNCDDFPEGVDSCEQMPCWEGCPFNRKSEPGVPVINNVGTLHHQLQVDVRQTFGVAFARFDDYNRSGDHFLAVPGPYVEIGIRRPPGFPENTSVLNIYETDGGWCFMTMIVDLRELASYGGDRVIGKFWSITRHPDKRWFLHLRPLDDCGSGSLDVTEEELLAIWHCLLQLSVPLRACGFLPDREKTEPTCVREPLPGEVKEGLD